MPALFRPPLTESRVDTLILQYRPRQYLAHVAVGTEQQHARPRRKHHAIPFDNDVPIEQKADWIGDLPVFGVATDELRLIPLDRRQVETAIHGDVRQRHTVIAVLRGIAEKALQ